MKLVNCNIEEFIRRNIKKRIICVGACNIANEAFSYMNSILELSIKSSILSNEFSQQIKELKIKGIDENIEFFVDNNAEIWFTSYNINGREIPIFPIEKLKSIDLNDFIICITNGHYIEVINQLDGMHELSNTFCYVYKMFKYYRENRLRSNTFQENKIPKIIHYCWFGGKPLTELANRCIESWRKYCPDYEIKEWNENNYDIFKNNYMRQAYENNKWAYVTDYARLDIVYNEGGIYFDTDVELVKNIDELLLDPAFFNRDTIARVATGLGFGAVKGHHSVRILRDMYETISFVNEDGSLNTIACPETQTSLLEQYGLVRRNIYQKIDDTVFYPYVYFDPIDLVPTDLTYGVHLYAGSWDTRKNVKEHNKNLREKREKIYELLERCKE